MANHVTLAALIFAVFAVALLVPAVAAAGEGNWRAFEAMAVVIAAYGFLSSILIMALRSRIRQLNRVGIFAAAITMWLALILAATPVFMLVEAQGAVQAFFEATSASVTLGITLRPVADISGAMAFYRAMTAWMGGLLTLLLAVYVIGPYRVGGVPNRHIRFIQHSQTEKDPRFFLTLRAVIVPYVALTALCALMLVLTRVSPPDALVISMSMLSTNGFVPAQTGNSILGNGASEAIMLIFMIVGATSIVWHRMLFERRWAVAREQAEGSLFITSAIGLGAIVAFASIFMPDPLHTTGQHAFNFAFDAISLLTTTGITHDQRTGIGLPLELVLLIVLIGGCSYSTAGGMKFFRVGGMLQHLRNELARLVYPNAMLRQSADHDPHHRDVTKAIWSAFFLAILTITMAVLLLALQGIDLPNALRIATGAFSQTGNVVANGLPGLAVGDVAPMTLVTIAALSIAARIEILVVLAALAYNRW